MPSAIARGPITNRLLLELATEGLPVGDNSAPVMAYGWQGEPNAAGSTFIPWLSLSPGIGSVQTPPGTFADSATEWRLSYNVFYAAMTRKQCEALADRMRIDLTNIAREKLDTANGSWQIQKLSCVALGNTSRISSAYPDYFTQADSFEVWITKG